MMCSVIQLTACEKTLLGVCLLCSRTREKPVWPEQKEQGERGEGKEVNVTGARSQRAFRLGNDLGWEVTGGVCDSTI